MTYQISKTGHHVDGVPMYRVRDGRNGPSYGPIDGRKSWPRAKAAAIAQLANETHDSPRAAARSRSRLTLAQAAERFITSRQTEGAYKMEHYRLPWIRRHVIGRVQLRNLTTQQGARWRIWLLKQGASDESVRKLLSLASAVVQDAIERGFGPKHNPFREVSRPRRGQKPAPRVMPLQHERQLQQLPAPSRCIVLMLLWSGLRRGELMGLELPDVAPCAEGYWLNVHRGTAGGDSTKTGQRRQVLLWGTGAQALSEWLQLHRPALKVRDRGNRRVFPVCLGRYIAAAVWAAAGLPHYTPNELRHTHSTGLTTGRWGYRWGRPEAAARMGHGLGVQEQHYLNATGGPAAKASREAAAAWAKIMDGPADGREKPVRPGHCATSAPSSFHRPALPDGLSVHSRAAGSSEPVPSPCVPPAVAGIGETKPPGARLPLTTQAPFQPPGDPAGDETCTTTMTALSTTTIPSQTTLITGGRTADRAKSAPIDPGATNDLTVDNPWKLLGRARCDSNARLLASEARSPIAQGGEVVETADGFERFGAPIGAAIRLAALVIAADAVGDRGAAAEYGVALAYAVLGAQAQERSA